MTVAGERNVSSTQPDRRAEERILVRAFAPLHALALGCASGSVLAAGLFLATSWLVLKGGSVIGPNLSLLGQYFPGFRVSWAGAFVGMAYGAVVGFALGFGIALLRNAVVFGFLRKMQARARENERKRLLDYV